MSVQNSLGADLSAAREARDLTLEQVEQQIKIRVHYLDALENDDYAALPSIVQGRGFLRNYARFLKMDADEAETRFNLGLIAQSRSQRRRRPSEPEPRRSAPSSTRPSTVESDTPLPTRRSSTYSPTPAPVSAAPIQVPRAPSRRAGLSDPAADRAEQRRRRTRTMTLRAIGALAIAAFILIALLTYGTHPNLLPPPIAAVLGIQSTATQTLPPAPTIPVVTPVQTALPTAIPDNANSVATNPPAANGQVTIKITVHDRSPLQVTLKDQIVYSGVPVPNTVLQYTLQGTDQLKVHTGNAASLDVTVNGIAQPSLGPAYVIADKTYTAADGQPSQAIAPPVSTRQATLSAPTSAVITFTPAPAVSGLKP